MVKICSHGRRTGSRLIHQRRHHLARCAISRAAFAYLLIMPGPSLNWPA
jgi:hypothetical protein